MLGWVGALSSVPEMAHGVQAGLERRKREVAPETIPFHQNIRANDSTVSRTCKRLPAPATERTVFANMVDGGIETNALRVFRRELQMRADRLGPPMAQRSPSSMAGAIGNPHGTNPQMGSGNGVAEWETGLSVMARDGISVVPHIC